MEGLLFNGLLAFVAGILLNFTPCVLPVIPLKIRHLLSEINASPRSRLLAALALTAGSLAFFTALGALTAFLGWKWGEIFQSRIFLAGLSTSLLVSGVAMLVNWTVVLPQFFYKVPIHRYLGAFLTGVLAGILATPCSGPFLGGVLAYALIQPPAVIVSIFVAVGLGLAFPYVLMLLAPGLLRYLPRGGVIGVQVESLLGWILIGGAIFFSQSLLPDFIPWFLWVGFGAMVLFWALWTLKKGKKWTQRLLPLSAMSLVILAFLALYRSSNGTRLEWNPYSEAQMSQALASGNPVLLEFTADWCLNCKVLEKTTYASPKVVAAAEQAGLVPIQVDMTDFGEDQVKLLERYGGTALPHAALLDRQGDRFQTFSGMFGADALEKSLLQLARGEKSESPKTQSASKATDWSPREGLSWIGKPAPEFQDIEWLQGGPLNLKDLKGKVVLLRFWLTGCPYCEASAPALNEFYEKYRNLGLVVIGLHHPKSEVAKNPEVVKEAAGQLGFKFPIGMDNSWKTIRAYGVGSEFKDFTSVSFVIDPQGIIRLVHDGGEFHRTDDPGHAEHEAAFVAIDELIQSLLSEAGKTK